MERLPWDQSIARALVATLAHSRVTPNMVTALTLGLAVSGAALFAPGDPVLANWGAGVFILARFLDHFDGELARLQGASSRFGYYFDYAAGGIGYAALYSCMGLGAASSALGQWAVALGALAALAALVSMFANLAIDRQSDAAESGDAVGYPALGGLELEDGMYLLGPVTWLGFATHFFVLASLGALVYTAVVCWKGFAQGRTR